MFPTVPTMIDLQNIPAPEPADGSLCVLEGERDLGFTIRRTYYIHGVQSDISRGHHAHKSLRQCLVVLNGKLSLRLEGVSGTWSFVLDSPDRGLLVPPGYWRVIEGFKPETVLLAMVSQEYDESDYIRDYAEFQVWVARQRHGNTQPGEESHQPSVPIPYLDLSRRYSALAESMDATAREILSNAQYILGPNLALFEAEFAAYCKADYFVGTGNGLDALELMLRASGVGAGDEVIICSHGFIATALAVLRSGAVPVFVDSLPDGNIDPAAIPAVVTRKSKAILLTHLYGIPADMDALLTVSENNGLLLFEDSCQAHGALYKGKPCGGLSHAAAFSFYPTKNLGGFGDGGGVCTNNAELASTLRALRNYGSSIKYYHEYAGSNSRLDELQAGFLRKLLPSLDQWNVKRRQLAQVYASILADCQGVRLAQPAEDLVPNWHIFPVFVADGRREALAEMLKANGVGTAMHYPTPLHLQPCCASFGHAQGSFPVAERVAQEELSLPLEPFMEEHQVTRIARLVTNFFTKTM